MTVSLDAMKAHLNMTGSEDDEVISGQLAAAQAHVEKHLGFALDDEDEFPTGTPADIDQAVKMLAAHWYENREATLVGVAAQSLPFGVVEIIAEHRRYTYG